ncbi:MAG TPA: hypothetical protein VGS41_19395 [Chthonomonadales bacterium]|nr:hypothetical protein [Chthonomonadales bacterium]
MASTHRTRVSPAIALWQPVSLLLLAAFTGFTVCSAARRYVVKGGQSPPASTWIGAAVDSFATSRPDTALLQSVLPADSPASADGGRNWMEWGHLASTRAAARLALPRGTDRRSAGLYAVRFRSGLTVAVCNRSCALARARIRARLPAGIYLIQKLDFQGAAAPQTAPVAQSASPGGSLSLAPVEVSREGVCALPSRGTIVRACWLKSGQACLLRLTDESKEARLSLYSVRRDLHQLAICNPSPTRRLERMFAAAEPYIDAIYPGYSRGVDRQIGSIHRVLLVTAQTASLESNYVSRGVVSSVSGSRLRKSLQRFSEGLAETSAAILGLVSRIQVAAAPGVRQAETSEYAGGSNNSRVTISLSNLGSGSVDFVKIGLDSSKLPHGVTCTPADSTYFGTLAPGQSVTASFLLRCPARVKVPGSRCVGDVCYFAGSAPAHLRPRAW